MKPKNHRIMIIAISVFMSLSITHLSFAAAGQITGVITNLESEALISTNIQVEGTSLGAITDLNGRYTLNLPPGEYTLLVRYIGYQSKRVDVVVRSGEKIIQNIELSPEILQGETIVVTAQAEGQMSAINQQISARNIKNVVAADRIQEIPDANAAESLGRLPGVSILRSGGEANKISIRGLSPQYNNVSIEGVQMTSTSKEDRSVSLASISSNTLAGIEIAKAITPDMPANSLGGSVNLRMKEAEPGFHSDVLLQGGYNGHDQVYDDYKATGMVSNRFKNNQLGAILTAHAERVNRGNDEWRGEWTQAFGKQYELNSKSLRLSDTKDVRSRYGASLVLDYEFSPGKLKFSNFYSQLNREYITRSVSYPGAESSGGRLNYSMTISPIRKRHS